MIAPLHRRWPYQLFCLFTAFLLLSTLPLWSQLQEWKNLANFEDRDILLLFDNGPELYAGVAGKGLLLSADEGQSWQELPIDKQSGYPSSLRIHQDAYYLTGLGGSVYQSTDAKTFVPISGNLPLSDLWASAVDGNVVYVVGNAGIFSTNKSDPGQWRVELPDTLYQREVLFDIDAKAGLVVAGGRRNLYLMDQQSKQWRIAEFDFQFDIRNIHIFNNQSIWVGTNGDGAYLSLDQGKSWTPVENDRLSQNIIFFSKSEPEELVSISTGGLYKSDRDLNRGEIVPSFKNIVHHKNHYYSGTTSAGIWKFELPAQPLVADDGTDAENHLVNLRLFPNPSTGQLSAALHQNFILPEGGDFQLQFFDLTGRMIKQIILPSGARNWQEDLRLETIPGTYRYDLVQDRQLITSGQLIISK